MEVMFGCSACCRGTAITGISVPRLASVDGAAARRLYCYGEIACALNAQETSYIAVDRCLGSVSSVIIGTSAPLKRFALSAC